MAILQLRILPPLAVGRLGASETPLEAFDLEVREEHPLDFRKIVPKESFHVDSNTGELTAYLPQPSIKFKDGHNIRPVAPFLEVFAVTSHSPNVLVPLTPELLASEGLKPDAISWAVEVANIKIYRRTGCEGDKIHASLPRIVDHQPHALLGTCPHFYEGKVLPLGSVQFIKPNEKFPQIRLRFTPAKGKVYGSSLLRTHVDARHLNKVKECPDPVIDSEDLVLYDPCKGTWRGYYDPPSSATNTTPANIYAGYGDKRDGQDVQISWGYIDDECDGKAIVTLDLGGGNSLSAFATIGAGPPAFAPDTLPIRVVSDELEQILLGPDVKGEVPIEEAEELVFRALETIRLMNTAVMNGNSVDGQLNVASTMVRQDTGDFSRYYEPIMAPGIVDNLALRALHESVFNGLSTGAAPWFSQVLRRPEEIGDLSDDGRRKMPGLMRNADGRALTLTRRQIASVVNAAASAMFNARPPADLKLQPTNDTAALVAGNRSGQLHYRGVGNPYSVLPRSAISNCFPGLEFDFRNLWRRAFEGIVLLECNNWVVDADPGFEYLKGKRLLKFDGLDTGVVTSGPVSPGGDPTNLVTTSNPNGVSFMEWSNSIARIIEKQGEQVVCIFNKNDVPNNAEILWSKDLETYEVKLTLRKFFEEDTAAFNPAMLKPGELTQGLCSPWQNDYRECACYYWAASRPDYVNVEPGTDGLSHGDMWMAKVNTGEYIPDDRADTRLWSYDDLFKNWQADLKFIIRGRDSEQSCP